MFASGFFIVGAFACCVLCAVACTFGVLCIIAGCACFTDAVRDSRPGAWKFVVSGLGLAIASWIVGGAFAGLWGLCLSAAKAFGGDGS